MNSIDRPNPAFARLRFGRLLLWPAMAIAMLGIVSFLPPVSRGGVAFVGAAYVFYGVLFLAACNACRTAGVSAQDILGVLPNEARSLMMPVYIAPLLLLFAGLSLWLTVFVASAVAPEWATELMSRRERSGMTALFQGNQRALLAANVALFGPLVEEVVFRGMLLRRWVETRGVLTGVFGSAAVFAVLHPPSWLGAFATGIVLSVIYLWSRSLVLPVLIHVLYNGIIAVMVMSGSDTAGAEKAGETGLAALRSQWLALSIAFLLTATLIAAIMAPLLREVRERRAG